MTEIMYEMAYSLPGNNHSGCSGKTLLSRVAMALGIEQKTLEGAFVQAQRQIQNEAVDNRLKGLIDQGKITRQQADNYMRWWLSRPDSLPGPGC